MLAYDIPQEATVAPRYCSVKFFAQELGICERSAWTLVKNGTIPILRVGTLVRIDHAAALEVLRTAPAPVLARVHALDGKRPRGRPRKHPKPEAVAADEEAG